MTVFGDETEGWRYEFWTHNVQKNTDCWVELETALDRAEGPAHSPTGRKILVIL